VRILVLEYITGGGMVTESVAESLIREGDLMLNAVLTDLMQISAIEVVVFRDANMPHVQWINNAQALTIILIENQEAFHRSWDDLVQSCDAVWPIAPETDGILEKLSRDVENSGKLLLSCSSEVVRQTASKHNTLRILEEHGIPVVPTNRLSRSPVESIPPWVIKPDDGVGCEGSCTVFCEEDLDRFYSDMGMENFIIQPLVDGKPCSLSVLFKQGTAVLLSCNHQCVTYHDRSIQLIGCNVNAVKDIDGKFASLATQIATAFPSLWGYAGIDLIVTEENILVLEINPRLTTSYAGLASALGINVAEMILAGHVGMGNFVPTKAKHGRSVFISLQSDNEYEY